jgi:heat shock protein HtpX
MFNNLKTFILLAGLTALLVGGGALLGGRTGMAIALGLAVLMNFAGYWFSDKIALSMSRAEEVGPDEAPELHEMVQRLAGRAGLPMPRVYVIPDMQPNAFATGRNPANSAVAVTEGIMRLLNRDELEGVIAHELAHIKNRDILIASVAAMLAGALTQLASMAQWAMILGMGRGDDQDSPAEAIGGVVMMVVAPVAAMLVQMAISRSREFEADRVGAEICGDPSALASALRKLERGAQVMPTNANPATAHMYIVNPLTAGQALMKLFSTHPPIDERVAKLQAMAPQRLVYGA